MLTNLDPSSELFLADISRIQRKLTEAGRQVSSGKRIAVASDQPDEVAPLLQLRTWRWLKRPRTQRTML